MNLMKQAVEVSFGMLLGTAYLCVMSNVSLSPQMYVHHALYDLIFKYVGTIEASEVRILSLEH